MTRCMIVLDGGTREQRDRVTVYLKNSGYSWWHHIESVWLLANLPVGASAKSLWDEIVGATGLKDARMLIILFNTHISHYGHMNPDAWPWMAQNFGVPQ